MTSRRLILATIIAAIVISGSNGFSQNLSEHGLTANTLPIDCSFESLVSSSLNGCDAVAESSPEAFVRSVPSGAPMSKPFHPFSKIGIASHAGLAGVGFDIATPLARNFNLRTGSDFFGYSTTFEEQGSECSDQSPYAVRTRILRVVPIWRPFPVEPDDGIRK
jgi:hypothetical protein